MTLLLRVSTAFVGRSRRFSSRSFRYQSSLAVAPPIITTDQEEELLHPDQFGPIPLPKNLSPSAVLEFKACPQSYLLQYLYKLRQPTTMATAKGSLCHEALEQLFDLDPPDRTLETLQNLLRLNWGQQRLSDKYRFLFESEENKEWDIAAEKEWGQSALQLLQNYYQVEDPREVQRPNPLRREIWLHAHLTVDPRLGKTSREKLEHAPTSPPETFYVRGIVDRLDMVKQQKGVALKIVDYKSGKAPTLKYTKPVNDRIIEESFYQLKVYALLLKEKKDDGPSLSTMDLRYLELLYLNSENGTAKPLLYDLGETQDQRDDVLQGIHRDLSQVWRDISDLVALQDPSAFVGCDRSFCHCHKCRPRFVPGTLWEPPTKN